MKHLRRVLLNVFTAASLLGCAMLFALAFGSGEVSFATSHNYFAVSAGRGLYLTHIEGWRGSTGLHHAGPDDPPGFIGVVVTRDPGTPGAAIGLQTWQTAGVTYTRYAMDVCQGYQIIRVPWEKPPGWRFDLRLEPVPAGAWNQILPVTTIEVDRRLAWLILLATPFLRWVTFVSRRIRRRSLQRVGRCSECGYDLRATPNQCPECGAVTKQTIA
jgi:hypothetical protein